MSLCPCCRRSDCVMGELQRQEAEAFRAIQANRRWRVIPDIDGGWVIRDHYGNMISEGITFMSAIEAARLWEGR